MSTVRQNILKSVLTELLNISSLNGYNFTIAEVKKGFFDKSKITNFPAACIYFGTDLLQNAIEGYAFGESKLQLWLLVYLNSSVENQVDDSEKLIQDIYRFFNKDENINPLYVSRLQEVPHVQGYNIIDTYPYRTNTNISSVGFIIEIDYMNFTS